MIGSIDDFNWQWDILNENIPVADFVCAKNEHQGKGGNLEKQRGCKIWYTTLWSTNLCTKKFIYFLILSV